MTSSGPAQCFALAWVALGCGGGGEILGDITARAGDASSNAIDAQVANATSEASTIEGAAAASLGRFGPAAVVLEVSDPSAEDEDPTFTSDLLELYFKSNRGGNYDIWMSQRATPSDRWGPPVRVAELSSPDVDQTPSVALDGLTIWFSSDRPASKKGSNIWVSTRPARGSTWSTPNEVTELDTDNQEVGPATDEDELIMVFGSDRAGGTAEDMYFSNRLDKGSPWSTPVLAAGINSNADDWDPFLGDHGLQVFFISDREAVHDDLFQVARSSLASPFGPAVPLSELNTPAAETDPTLSQDLRYIMFGSDRSGNREIWEARR